MNTPIKQMTELEFEQHLKECYELARRNSWVHVFENTVRFDPVKMEQIKAVRQQLKKAEKALREI